MASDSQSMIKYAVVGIGAMAIAGLMLYLSRDEGSSSLDYKRFTKEKLRVLMDEMQLELTCIYARNYNLLLKIKENGQDDDELMDSLRVLINRETKDKQQQVIEDFCLNCHPEGHSSSRCDKKVTITMAQFQQWVERFEDEPFMVKGREAMQKLDEDLFVRQRI